MPWAPARLSLIHISYVQCLIHPLLVGGGNLPGALPQAVLIQHADLFQQHHAVLGKAGVRRPDVDAVSYTHLDVYKRQADMPLLAEALRREGFTEDEVEAIYWRNAYRFFKNNL